MRPAEDIKKMIRNWNDTTSARMDEQVLADIGRALEQSQTQAAPMEPSIRRLIMKSPIAKVAAAALVAVALILSVSIFTDSTPVASAAEVFYQAAEAMDGLASFHIKVKMRTPPNDNFSLIGLDREFVPIDFWKQCTDDEQGRWRLESPGRVVVMDGRTSTMFMKHLNEVHEADDPSPERYWKECLVEVNKVMVREAGRASEHPAAFTTYRETAPDGREMIVIAVEMPTYVPPEDYLRNKYLESSDHLKRYRFNAQTKLLEDLEIYVHDNGRDVLVFQLVEAEYNIDLDPGLFALDLPADVIRSVPLEILPDNERYEQMTPKEAATAFFTACAEENWDELVKFLGQTGVSQPMKDYLGGLEIVSIGEAFQSAKYRGWFVPYEIRLRSGHIKKHNLALRNDNPAHRFQLDGGV